MIEVHEMAVQWQDIDGSHLNIVDASFQMVRDMLMVKALYTLRLWKTDDLNW